MYIINYHDPTLTSKIQKLCEIQRKSTTFCKNNQRFFVSCHAYNHIEEREGGRTVGSGRVATIIE